MTIGTEVLIQLAVGLGLFAFGWTLFRFGVNAVGFGLGFLFGFSLYRLLLKSLPTINPDWLQYFPQHPAAVLLCGCVTGIAGLFLAKQVYKVTIFLGILGGVAYLLYATPQRELLNQVLEKLTLLEPINRTFGDLWPAILSLAAAGAFLLLQKQMTILLTACVGSFLLTEALNFPILFLPLCFIGYWLQQKQKNYKRREE